MVRRIKTPAFSRGLFNGDELYAWETIEYDDEDYIGPKPKGKTKPAVLTPPPPERVAVQFTAKSILSE